MRGGGGNRGIEMVGRWRGGDDRVRRGDIVEWRKVRIGMKNRPGGFYTLGDPDHTAVIVLDAVPSTTTSVEDGCDLSPADLGILVVVEQSVGRLPKKTEYDLSMLEEGEMWIYRPIGIQAYLGISGITSQSPEELAGVLLRLE